MTTPTVTLRARTDADADTLFAIASDLDTWEERNPWAPAPMTREVWDARQARLVQDSGTHGPSNHVGFVVDVDGIAVGSMSLFDVDRFAGHAEVGIALARDARGRGIGSAAVALLVEFAFVRQNLRRLHLQVVASNAAALHVYEKAGFVVEGRRREHAWVRGRYEDIVIMGLLRSGSGPG